jgi:pyruvate formate lyase activating enzyme
MALRVKMSGLKVKLDTNGTVPENLYPLIENGLLDYAAVNVKGLGGRYEEICGVDIDGRAVSDCRNPRKGSEFFLSLGPQCLRIFCLTRKCWEWLDGCKGEWSFTSSRAGPVLPLTPGYRGPWS